MIRRLAAASLLAALATLEGCTSVELDVSECERLRSFSCGCFRECRPEDQEVIEADKAGECTARLKSAYESWRETCAAGAECGGDCRFAWSNCTFEVYREVGLEPSNACPGVDAGASDSGPADGAATD